MSVTLLMAYSDGTFCTFDISNSSSTFVDGLLV